MDPFVPAWLKSGLTQLGRMLIPVVRRINARRGAEQGLPSKLPEFNEALDLLAGGSGVVGQAVTGVKALANDVPSAFREERFQRWAGDPVTREAFRRAAMRRWQGFDDVEQAKARALARYAEIASDARQRAERPFEDAVAFLVLFIKSFQSASERIADEKDNADRSTIVEEIKVHSERVGAALDRVLDGVNSRPTLLTNKNPARTPEELADVSADLLSWPGDINGRVMARPELDRLEQLLTEAKRETTGRSILLFGPPGSGKSALLASLGNRLRRRGGTVLGIKADALPTNVSTLADLGPALDLGPDIVEEIAAQTSQGAVYVLIDQLDAVASLIDGSGGRLRALSGLVRRLRTWPDVRIVASVRPFEFAADGGFRTAFPENAVNRVDLALPERAAVNEILSALGIDPAELPNALDEVIRVPQALRDIIAARRDGFAWGAMTSWRSTQALRFDRLVAGNPALGFERLIDHMVGALRDSGTLWSGTNSLPLGSAPAVDRLCAEGILRRSDEGGAIGFAHQTWAETLDARLALAQGDLATRVTEAGRNLLARPQALAVLRYAREAAALDYDAAIGNLWNDRTLRRHLRHLILDLAAGSDMPTQVERQIVVGVVAGEDSALADRALRLTAGKTYWFDLLRGPIADRMASDNEARARSVWYWLSEGIVVNNKKVLDLLERHWKGNKDRERFIPNILEKLELWDEQAFSLFGGAVDRSERFNIFSLGTIRKQAAAGRHAVAARLLGLIFDRVIILAQDAVGSKISAEISTTQNNEDGLHAAVSRLQVERDQSFSYQLAKELRELHGLHDLADLVRKSPKPYVECLVPRFYSLTSAGAGALDDQDLHELQASHHRKAQYDLPIVEGLHVALAELARIEPKAFTDVVVSIGTGHKLLDRLFASAFLSNIDATAETALAFLAADSSRLRLGDRFSSDQDETFYLIEALSSYFDHSGNNRLLEIVSLWNEYEIDPSDDVRQRRLLRYGNRRLRARLLSGFDISRLSPQARRFVQEELRAVPESHRERIRSMGGWVHSPMSTEAMERASDDHILDLFRELPDGRERWHSDPIKSFVGGAREAATAFGELAKRQPERVQGLLKHFSSSKNQLPVGAALRCLSEVKSVDPQRVLQHLADALDRGFGDRSFRADAIWTLHQLGERLSGLDDRWIAVLLSWIDPVSEDVHATVVSNPISEKLLPHTVLFEGGRLRLVSEPV